MGTITLQSPTVGQPNSTEEPKITSNFTTLQTAINGNLDDTNLFSPNNSVRRQLLNANGFTGGAATTAGNYIIVPSFQTIATGANVSGGVPIWVGDAGLSSQPQDFQVANKSAFGRVRVCVMCNATPPGVTLTFGLYAITASAGGSSVLTYTFGSAVAGTTAAIVTPAASGGTAAESAQFALPGTAAFYALGMNSSGTCAAASFLSVHAQLYCYNA